jgi:molecular chaperone DnaJ
MAARDLYEKDFYKVLGVSKTSSADEIKKKYRQLARDLHPDQNKGDSAKEERFKEVSEAYDILSDAKKRAEYDEARSLFERGGMPRGGENYQGDFSDLFGGGSPQDIFANLFGGRRGPRKGQDLQTESTITFRESIYGTTLDLRLNIEGKSQQITARVPAGVQDGAKIRVKGKGAPGEAGPGDLFIYLHVKPHPVFARKGDNLTINLPITFAEAALGADVKVPTLEGSEVTVRIAPGTPSGRTLRVKGRGVTRGHSIGDLLVTVDVQVPRRIEGKVEAAIKAFAEATKDEDVRAEFNDKARQ